MNSTESSTGESKDEGHSRGWRSLREFPEEVNVTYHWRMGKMEKRKGIFEDKETKNGKGRGMF